MANDHDDRAMVIVLGLAVIVLLFLLWRSKNAAPEARGAGSLFSPQGTGEAESAAPSGAGSGAGAAVTSATGEETGTNIAEAATPEPTTEDHSHLPSPMAVALPGHATSAGTLAKAIVRTIGTPWNGGVRTVGAVPTPAKSKAKTAAKPTFRKVGTPWNGGVRLVRTS